VYAATSPFASTSGGLPTDTEECLAGFTALLATAVASALHGRLWLESPAGGGTLLRAAIPLG
jgi:hypothetical protein